MRVIKFLLGGLVFFAFLFLALVKGVTAPDFKEDIKTSPKKDLSEAPSAVPLISPSPWEKPFVEPPKTKNTEAVSVFKTQDVPFIVQAPRHNWKDPVYQNACEEAVSLMAMRWVENKKLTPEEAFTEIKKLSDYSKTHYGFYLDQSAEDLAKLMTEYFKYDKIFFRDNISLADIKEEISKNNIVLVPANGQKLGNPFFTSPGPTEHMLLIKGYDPKTKEFITNDPGVGKGNGYRYKENVLFNAIRRYPSGYKEKIESVQKVMIVVEK